MEDWKGTGSGGTGGKKGRENSPSKKASNDSRRKMHVFSKKERGQDNAMLHLREATVTVEESSHNYRKGCKEHKKSPPQGNRSEVRDGESLEQMKSAVLG